MIIGDLDHINLRTAALKPIIDFYCEILGMRKGPRPDFGIPGAWLYAGLKPLIHVTVHGKRGTEKTPRIDHFAFSAQDLRGVTAKLRKLNIPYRTQLCPGSEIRQIFLHDPDGNQVELDFLATEKGNMENFLGHSQTEMTT